MLRQYDPKSATLRGPRAVKPADPTKPANAREIHRMPKNTVDVNDPDTARKVLKLMNRLDDQEDVQNVSSNYEIPDAVMAQVGEE